MRLRPIVLACTLAATAAGAQDFAELKIPVSRWQVEGNTLLPGPVVEGALAPYLGPSRSLDDLRAAQRDLEAAYRRAGYSAVTVVLPEQELNAGAIRLRVVEGKIGQVRIVGNRHFDEGNLRASIPALREGETPNARAIDANVRLANESPAKRLDVTLSAGRDPATVDARVNVEDLPPQRFGATLDNTGNAATGHSRIGISYQNANLWNRDHVLSAQFLASLEHPDKVQVYSAGYRLPLYSWNSSVDAFAAKSDVAGVTTATTAGAVSFGARGTILGLRYNYHLPRFEGIEQKLTAGVDRRAYDNACTLAGFGAAGCGAAGTDVTVRPLGLAWTGQLARPGLQAGLNIGYARNLSGGSNGSAADFEAARSGASPNYDLWRINAQAGVLLRAGWQLQGLAALQFTRHALVPGEQVGIGGATSVRGFVERAAANDKGGAGSVELYTPDLAEPMTLPGTFRLLLFGDAGSVSRNKALPGEETRTRLASVGLGARFAFGRNFALRLDLAHAVHTDGHDSLKQQAHFLMQYYF